MTRRTAWTVVFLGGTAALTTISSTTTARRSRHHLRRTDMSQSTRGYLYRVSLAILPILVALGFITIEMSGLVAGLLVAVFAVGELGLGMAAKHTPTKTAGDLNSRA